MSIPYQVESLAAQLLPHFMPKNAAETTLSFQFTMAPNTTYKVNYQKKQTGAKTEWILVDYQEITD